MQLFDGQWKLTTALLVGPLFVVLTALPSNATTPDCTSEEPTCTVVATTAGQVQGVIQGHIRAFRGIPYAAPPVGDLRWRPPQPVASWSGIRDASTFGSVCIQKSNGKIVGSEDCLTLNVFTSVEQLRPKQPVMVFFHGGGNGGGNGQHAPFDTPPLANHGVVVVTAEYRLGLLGWFAHSLLTSEGNGASGNYGLLDQIAVLSWVHDNISAFGGDSRRVMVFGQSAGGYDVQAILSAPAASGLFSRAAIESNAIPRGQLPALSTLETWHASFPSLVGCDAANDVLICLRALPADSIVAHQRGFYFLPAIGNSVLPVDPFDALERLGSSVPLLIGSTREESTGIRDDAYSPLDSAGYEAEVHAEFDPFGPTVAANVVALYPIMDYDSPQYALIGLHSDFWVTCEVRSVALAAAHGGGEPIWRYLYTHRYQNDPYLNAQGAFHTAELPFVFGNLNNVNDFPYTPTPADVDFSEQMMSYWSRFAATGNPNGGNGVHWPKYRSRKEDLLQLDDNSQVISGYHIPQCNYLSTLPQP